MRNVRRHHEPLDVLASLNVTNLIDTAFILLITFMLVAPHLTHGIQLELPQADAPVLDEDTQKTYSVSITEKLPGEEEERIYLDGERVTLQDLEDRLADAHSRKPDTTVTVSVGRGTIPAPTRLTLNFPATASRIIRWKPTRLSVRSPLIASSGAEPRASRRRSRTRDR